MNTSVRSALLFGCALFAATATFTPAHAHTRKTNAQKSVAEACQNFEQEVNALSDMIQSGVVKTVFAYEKLRSVTVIKRMVEHAHKLRDAAQANTAKYEQLARNTFALHEGISERAPHMKREHVREWRRDVAKANDALQQQMSSDPTRAQDEVELSAMAINYGMMRVLHPEAFRSKGSGGISAAVWGGIAAAVVVVGGAGMFMWSRSGKGGDKGSGGKGGDQSLLVLTNEQRTAALCGNAANNVVAGSGDGLLVLAKDQDTSNKQIVGALQGANGLVTKVADLADLKEAQVAALYAGRKKGATESADLRAITSVDKFIEYAQGLADGASVAGDVDDRDLGTDASGGPTAGAAAAGGEPVRALASLLKVIVGASETYTDNAKWLREINNLNKDLFAGLDTNACDELITVVIRVAKSDSTNVSKEDLETIRGKAPALAAALEWMHADAQAAAQDAAGTGLDDPEEGKRGDAAGPQPDTRQPAPDAPAVSTSDDGTSQ